MSKHPELPGEAASGGPVETLTYRQARLVVLGFGGALISGAALAAYLRGADLVEVGAVLLFLPVLVGLTLDNVRGGTVAAVLAAAVYGVVRFRTLGGLPIQEFVGTAVVRVLLYIGLGVFGGWANSMLEHALVKLELYDEVDDDTGVGNARALVSALEREIARADRYGTALSVALLQVDRLALEAAGRKGGVHALRRLCTAVESSVRTTDLVHRIPFPDAEVVVVVLTDTGRTGARQLLQRLVDGAREVFDRLEAGVTAADLHGDVLAHPGDAAALDELRERAAAVAGARHLVAGAGRAA